MIIRALGIDPGFANCAFCLAEIDVEKVTVMPKHLDIVRTSKASKADIDNTPVELMTGGKKELLSSYDDFRRLRIITSKIQLLEEKVDVVISEMPTTGAKNHNAAKALAYALALVSTCRKPIVQVTPSMVKELTVGDRNATKEEMISWAVEQHPALNWVKRGGKLVGWNEHMADALAAIYAGIQTEQFERFVVQFLQQKVAA